MNVEHVFIIAVIHCTMVANVVESVPVQGMSHANHFSTKCTAAVEC